MGWFHKREKPQQQAEPPRPDQEKRRVFKTVYFPDAAHMNVDERLFELASETDESVLREAVHALPEFERSAIIGPMALPPITSAKVATLSLLMFDSDPALGQLANSNLASFALWQLLMSSAKPDQVALLERIMSPTSSHENYDVAYGVVSGLMASSLGRDLKAGEMENARRLVGHHLGLVPDSSELLHQ